MSDTRAHYYDGHSSQRVEVILRFLDGGGMHIQGPGIDRHCAPTEIRREADIGSQRPSLYLTDGSKCELLEDADLDAHLPQRRGDTLVHRLENRLRYVVVAAVLTVITLWGLVQYGVPVLAEQAAFLLPEETSTHIGAGALQFLDRSVFEPSRLPEARRAALQSRFDTVTARHGYSVEFRHSDTVGANALALPSGTIVFTDDMIRLAEHDEELLGVLAHEIGHLQQRHALRQLLQDSIAALLLILMTGDLTSSQSLMATLPVYLLQTSFSRTFETEADQHAAEFLVAHHISPSRLADILARLDASKSNVPTFLSTHPAPHERIQYLNGVGDN